VRVSAKAGKQIVTRLKSVQQVKRRNGAPRPVGLAVLARQHQRRAAITLDDARGRDSDHAAVPSVAVQHQAKGVAQVGRLRHAFFDRRQDALLFLLAVAVELVQAGSDGARPLRVLDAEQFDDVLGDVHAAGGVQARGHAKGHIARSQRLSARQRRRLQQSLQPEVDRAAETLEAELGEDAVLAHQRHRVGDGSNGDHLEE
jgi:hypothetical protein